MAITSSQPDPIPQSFHRQLSGTSVALICVFFVCFVSIAYLSAKTSRATVTPPVLTAPSLPRRFTAARRRPKLWETWLDSPLGGTVHSWRPLAAWHNDDPGRVDPRQETIVEHHIALARECIGRACAFRRERRGAVQFSASSPPVPPDSDHRMLNVAVLVAMPRRRDLQLVPGSVLHPSDGSGLLNDEGQLELGVTSLLYEQVAQEEYERTK